MGRKSRLKRTRSAARREWDRKKGDMVRITLSLPYVVRPEQRVDIYSSNGVQVSTKPSAYSEDRKVTFELFEAAMRAKYPEGAGNKTIRKMNGRIRKALTQAIIDQRDEVEVEREQFEHLREVFGSWDKCPTAYEHWLLMLEEHLDEVHDAIKAADEAKKGAKNGVEKPEAAKAAV